MGIRSIEGDNVVVSSTRMWVKICFLVLVVGAGMYFLASGSKKTGQQDISFGISNSVISPTVSSVSPTPQYTLQDVQEQGVKLANDTMAKAEDSIGQVLGEVTEKVADQVSDQVEKTASDSAQVIIDYAYKNTLLEVFKQLKESLPVRQQTEFEKMVCNP